MKDENPELWIELQIGNLRHAKGLLAYAKRKNMSGKQADELLDNYNKERAKLLLELKNMGYNYTEGEEDNSKYDNYDTQ